MFAATSAAMLLAGAISGVAAQDGVFATGTMGVTNPPKPTLGTAINQTSDARLLSINSVDDFCIFAPPEVNEIGNSEAFEVAWCTKARNNARVIPDGTLTGVSFLKTDFYVQVMGYGDFTKLNVAANDAGGELDPHGAEGLGNPIGGNVTVNINGEDKNIEEWMMFISYNQFCLRACINANSTYSAAAMCEHKLDVMGCNFVMPGNYNFDGSFESCDADVAYPPGWYPEVAGGQTSYSKFEQYWTGVVGGQTFTVGDTVTPGSAFSTPSSSNCKTTATVGNGLDPKLLTAGATGPVPTESAATATGVSVAPHVSGSASVTGSNRATGSGASTTGSAGSSNNSNAASPAFRGAVQTGLVECITLVSLITGVAAIAMFH
ncbi:hypothetical protein VNI00_013996 [Paramarasmius palmivorus]|uniref:Uncharacterized protein n=1 Tax=Paramarasmius palmivorus TaxID=297713 RepID=A0AAW0BVQ7_9AGAR